MAGIMADCAKVFSEIRKSQSTEEEARAMLGVCYDGRTHFQAAVEEPGHVSPAEVEAMRSSDSECKMRGMRIENLQRQYDYCVAICDFSNAERMAKTLLKERYELKSILHTARFGTFESQLARFMTEKKKPVEAPKKEEPKLTPVDLEKFMKKLKACSVPGVVFSCDGNEKCFIVFASRHGHTHLNHLSYHDVQLMEKETEFRARIRHLCAVLYGMVFDAEFKMGNKND